MYWLEYCASQYQASANRTEPYALLSGKCECVADSLCLEQTIAMVVLPTVVKTTTLQVAGLLYAKLQIGQSPELFDR